MRIKWLVSGLLWVLACLCALFLPVDLLPLDEMSQEITLGTDGDVYMAVNHETYSRIVAADQDGVVRYCYEESSRGQDRTSAVGPMAVTDGQIYFIRWFGNGQLVKFGGWELVRLDQATGASELLYVDSSGSMQVTDLSVAEQMVYISGISQANRAGESVDTIELYRLNLEEPEPQLLQLTAGEVPSGVTAVTAVHGGGSTLCALLSDGSLVSTSGNLVEAVSVPEECLPLSGLNATAGYLWARGAVDGEFLTGTAYRLRAREVNQTLLSGASTSNMLALRVYTESGRVALARAEGDDVRLIEQLQVPLAVRLQLRWKLVALVAVAALAALLLIWLVIRFICGHRLRSRMTAAIVGLSAVFFAAVVLLAAGSILQTRYERTEQTAAWYAQNLSSTLTYGSLSGGAEGQPIDSLLAVSEEADISVACAVYDMRGETETPVYLSRDGLTANADVIRSVRETGERGFLTSRHTLLDGRSTSLCAVPVRQAGEMTSVLVVLVSEAAQSWMDTGMLGLFIVLAVGLFLLCAVTMALVIRRHLRPLVPMVAQMDRLSIGDTNLDDVPCANDELGKLWQAIKELSVGMAIRDYELNMTLESCRRFVPNSMEQLLERGTVTEIAAGDLVASDGSLGLITFGHSERMRSVLNDREFMDYVNRCFVSVSQSIRPEGGVLLTGGFDLSAVRVLFAQSPDRGVHAMLSLIGETVGAKNGTDCCVLLHHAHFLYGIAGTQDEAFPYLASSEVSFFSSKLADMAETGCRLVVTEQFLRTLSESFSTRYIGYFAAADGRTSYKLYEVLDCYGELERTQREQYDARLQEAIRCFYQNDFYLARNLFLAILRLCPQDGVARWYLFACEHYFNAGVGEEARYDLFGIVH